MPVQCGIYCIHNTINGKRYIGQSVDMQARMNQHGADLRRGAHRNDILQRSYIKHGNDAFRFYVLEETQEAMLDFREVAWIEYYNTTDDNFGYNIESGGRVNRIIPESTRAKMSAAKLGKKRPAFTADTIAKMKLAASRRTPEQIARAAAAKKGIKHTPESIEKMKVSQRRWRKLKKENDHG